MIKLTRLSHVPMILNSDLIEHIDATPDTVITLTSGQKIVVLENADDVVEKIVAFRRSIFHRDSCCAHFEPLGVTSPQIHKPETYKKVETPQDPSHG